MARPVILVCAVFLLLPAPAMGESSDLHAVAAVVHGQGALSSDVVGAVLQNATVNADLRVLVAAGILVLNDDATVSVGSVGVTPAQFSSRSSPLENASLDGFRLGPNVRVLVVANRLAAATTDVNGTELRAATEGTMQFQNRASSGPAWTIATDRSMEVHPSPTGQETLHGAFKLIIWDAAFTVHNETGDHVVQTGSVDEPIGPPGSPTVRRVQREAVVMVENGTLLISHSLPFRFFVAAASLELTTGALSTMEPGGTNPVTGEPLASGVHVLQLSAPLGASLAANGHDVGLAFPMPPGGAVVDGRIVRPTTSNSLPLAPVVIGMVAVLGGTLLYSRVQLRRRVRVLDRLVRGRDFDAALILAGRIRRARPRHPDALVAEALCLVHTKEYAKAEAVLAVEGWTVALGPLRDYLRATAASGQGKRGEALRWLKRCLRNAPDMVGDVAANLLLKDLVGAAMPKNRSPTLPRATPGGKSRGNHHALLGDA